MVEQCMTHSRFPTGAFGMMLLAIMACTNDLTGVSQERLILTVKGTWVRSDQVPGSMDLWMMDVQGGHITGTGSWAGEACCAGTLTIDGRLTGDSIHVDVERIRTTPS